MPRFVKKESADAYDSTVAEIDRTMRGEEVTVPTIEPGEFDRVFNYGEDDVGVFVPGMTSDEGMFVCGIHPGDPQFKNGEVAISFRWAASVMPEGRFDRRLSTTYSTEHELQGFIEDQVRARLDEESRQAVLIAQELEKFGSNNEDIPRVKYLRQRGKNIRTNVIYAYQRVKTAHWISRQACMQGSPPMMARIQDLAFVRAFASEIQVDKLNKLVPKSECRPYDGTQKWIRQTWRIVKV